MKALKLNDSYIFIANEKLRRSEQKLIRSEFSPLLLNTRKVYAYDTEGSVQKKKKLYI